MSSVLARRYLQRPAMAGFIGLFYACVTDDAKYLRSRSLTKERV